MNNWIQDKEKAAETDTSNGQYLITPSTCLFVLFKPTVSVQVQRKIRLQ